MISAFLERARGLWDELVVVDTGSTDDTVALLERVGARVLHRAWDDDFSAARNAGLAEATGEWIVVLDADEMVSSEFVGEVRALVAQGTVGAATIPIRNPLPSGSVRQTPLLRVFRRDDSIRYEHRIHEDASVSILAMLQRTGRSLAAVKAPVEHLGYVRERAAERDKFQRDLGMLERSLAANPSDLYAHFKRLELARYWGDRPLMALALAEGVPALERNPQALRTLPAAAALLALVARETRGDTPEEAAAWLTTYETKILPTAEFYYARGEFYERAGRTEEATGEFQRALAVDSDRVDQYGGVRPHLGLCRVALMQGCLDQAAEHARLALQCSPREPEALLVSIALATARGGMAGQRLFAEAYRRQFGDDVALAYALADDALTRRDGRAAIEALQPWLQGAGPAQVAYRLAKAHVLCGEPDAARPLVQAALLDMPEAGLGVLVCNMATAQSTSLQLDMEPAQAHAVMREWTDALIDSRELTQIGTFLRMVGTVQGLFPWLDEHCQARLAPILQSVAAG